MSTLIATFSLFFSLYFICSFQANCQDNSIYSSPYTQSIIKNQLPHNADSDLDKLAKELLENLKSIEKRYQDYTNPGGVNDIFQSSGTLNAIGEGLVKGIPLLGSVVTELQEEGNKQQAEDMQPFINERLFGQTSALNNYFVELREFCNNDLTCIKEASEAIAGDPGIRNLLGANPDMVESAKINELIAAAAANAEVNHSQTMHEFENQAALMTALTESLHVQLSAIAANQETLLNNTAQIINTQQLHTVALTRIQATIEANQEELRLRLEQGFGTVIALQVQNLFLTEMVLEHTQFINQKLDLALERLGDIGEDVNTIRARQLDQIFNESPLAKKLQLLEGPTGQEYIADEAKRREMIENVKIMIEKERLIAITKKVREWGLVSLEALNVFYPGCPPEIKQLVSVAITASDIVGSITAGNWSQAIMSGLSLFKTPTPGPEMQMLQRITEQLSTLQTSMNAQFREVHEHLFAMEENIVGRLEIIDQKLDMISRQIELSYTALSEGLLSANSKLSYIVNQNSCTEDLILDIFRFNNADICEAPVRAFKQRVLEGRINSITDLEEFFIGQHCKDCVESLFSNSSQNLINSPLFRYSYCNPEAVTENNRPDNMYDYIFNYLVPDSVKGNPFGLFSIMHFPDNVMDAATIQDSINALPDSLKNKIRSAYSSFVIADNDRHYRHYMAVLELADYVITMMPFLELYNNGGLMSYPMINGQPEITRERSRKLIGVLDNLSVLIQHTIFQQSLMAGMSSFASVDQLLEQGDVTSASGITLGDVFRYNPVMNKNYSAYFIQSKLGGSKNFQRILQTNPYAKVGKYYRGGNHHELFITKDAGQNVILETNYSTSLGKKSVFQAYMPAAGSVVDTVAFNNNLLTAIPRALPALRATKKRVDMLSAEMKFIISDELDRPGAGLTRKEFDSIIQAYKNN